MLGTDRDPVVIDEMLIPPEMYGVRCISIGYFVPQGEAVIWRGPMLHKALEQFLTDVFWDEPDFLLDRHAARHRRHRALARRSTCRAARCSSSPRRSRPHRRSPRCRRRWPRRSTCRCAASSRTCRGSPATTASGTRSSARAAARNWPTNSACRCSASCRWCPRLREGGDDGKPITVVDPESEAAQIFHEMATQDRRRHEAEEGLLRRAQDPLSSDDRGRDVAT